MEEGYLAIVIHAHLPHVRRPPQQNALEERWLYEAITESYIPLLLVLDGLIEDDVDFRLTVSLSPTLAAMLGDPLLQSRYAEWMERLIELAEKEEARTKGDAALYPLARMYRSFFRDVRDAFVNRYGRNLLHGFRRIADLGKVDLMATAATHAYLPLLSVNESAVRAQIRLGVEHHRLAFGRQPKGFWLPECGYHPGVDAFLRAEGNWFTILETHGVTRASCRPRYGVYAPIYTPSGIAAFGRDPDASRQVWSSTEGYPGDYDYREFYRDIGHDLDLKYIGPYVLPDGIRVDTGIKYFRITGRGDHKEPYVPQWAETKAERHAEHFFSESCKHIQRLTKFMDRKPIVVAPYDAELFGHWWFEGPMWLNHLIRKIALSQGNVRLITLPEYLESFPVNQTAEPSMSSWGSKGFNEVWLNTHNQWLYPHLHAAGETMEEMAVRLTSWDGLASRALDQAARELLLAQASDWPFMMSAGRMREYAVHRSQEHLMHFHRLQQQIESGVVDQEYLALLEHRDDIFANMRPSEAFRVAPLKSSSEPYHIASQLMASFLSEVEGIQPPARPLHIAMVCPEIAPFAKTGGLADMVSSLAVALERLDQRVTLIMPAYRDVLNSGFPLEDTEARVAVSVAGRYEEARILSGALGRQILVYFVRADHYFDRGNLYSDAGGDYSDNAERFSFFAHAVLELLGRFDRPDVLHAHDWQTALAITLLKTQPERYPGLASVRTLFTVHNLGYQGVFPSTDWGVLGLDSNLFNPQCLEFYGNINFMKGGLVFADLINTVSATYAKEIRTAEYGFGLEGIFEQRASNLTGILNGADYDVWNPSRDPHIARQYSIEERSGKGDCKADLQRRLGLPADPDVPLIGCVSRLAYQKGFDLVQSGFDSLLDRNVQFVLLGTGDKQYEDYFRLAVARYKGKAGIHLGYEESLAHKIIAGADMFLMPSRYEPSGLTQLYSLKYGTIPIVRATGGLKDSIEDFDAATGKGTGFSFERYDASALLDVIGRALVTFEDKKQWAVLMTNAMRADYSWNRSALEYHALYRRLAAR